MLRITKKQVFQLVSEKAPEYTSIFIEFKIYDGGWLRWPDRLIKIKENLKLDSYVLLYQDQRLIDRCFILFLMGEDGLKEWNDSTAKLSREEQEHFVEEFTQDLIEDDLEWLEELLGKWTETPEEEARNKAQFDALGEEEKKLVSQRISFLFMHLLSSLHNYFSLMVCGEKMTSLVPKAMNGDDEAFCKAVKIDRNLLVAHPYFIERYQKAQAQGEREFLRHLSHHQSTPGLLGKISYPGLYVVFAMLESLGWLDDLTHSEILDICDKAGLDRWQNRIEDVNYVTKRLAGYRRYQKTGGVSMH